MNSYQDRQLKPPASSNDYAAAEFALCYQCHGEAPFRDTSGDPRSDTSFPLHGFHLNQLYDNPGGGGSSRDIGVAGAGQGNALCAECHFRLHSTAYATYPDQQNALRLVNFAPDVTGPSGSGAPIWDNTNLTCSLTCHGKVHDGKGY